MTAKAIGLDIGKHLAHTRIRDRIWCTRIARARSREQI